MRYKKHVIITVLISLLLPLTVYFAAFQYLKQLSNRIFIEDKFAKSIHMSTWLEKSNKDIDYIFIGSSSTQNMVSTYIMNEHNLTTYNYSRPSVFLLDMPYMVEKAIAEGPKHIVLGLSLAELYKIDPFYKTEPMFPSQFDYDFINQAIGTHYQFNSLSERVFNEYRLKDIVFRINGLYTEQQIKQRLDRLRVKEEDLDCEVTNYRGGKNRTVFLCQNGDGAIVTRDKPSYKQTRQRLQINDLSHSRITLLNALIGYCRQHDIVPVVLFLPIMYDKRLTYDKEYLYSLIETDNIIDTTNRYKDNYSLWSDRNHLNYMGRKIYTHYLMDQFEGLTKQ